MQAAIMIENNRTYIGVMQSVFMEFERHRLPRLLRLKDKLDSGETLNDTDFEFLCKEINDACVTKHLTFYYPELEEFCLHVGHLYKDLCDLAVDNEKY